jgi:hypothetical protein
MTLAVGTLLGVLLGYLIGRRRGPRVKPTYLTPLNSGQPSNTTTFVGSYPRQAVSWSEGGFMLPGDARPIVSFEPVEMPIDEA